MTNVDNEDVKADGGQAPAESTPAAPPAGETTDERVSRAERERAEAHDRMLRVAADFENYKRRVRREIDDATGRVKEQILREILPVLDNFERALVAVGKGGTMEALEQGVRLVEKQLHGALEKSGVKGFDAKGQPFDPARHEAIQQVETAAQPAGTVVDVFARGYMLGDRLLRPAMVSVAKAPPAPSPADSGDGAAKSE